MNKKNKIILTTLELVVEQGVHATPMSQIAKRSNVAIGTIYNYFKNKEQIIEEIYAMIYKDFGVVLMANVPESGVKKQFETMWLNLYNYFLANPLAFKFIEFIGVPPIITANIRNENIQHFTNIRDFLLAGILSEDIRNVDLRLIMQMSFGNVISATRLKFKDELEMNNKQLDDALKMSWDCIKNPKKH